MHVNDTHTHTHTHTHTQREKKSKPLFSKSFLYCIKSQANEKPITSHRFIVGVDRGVSNPRFPPPLSPLPSPSLPAFLPLSPCFPPPLSPLFPPPLSPLPSPSLPASLPLSPYFPPPLPRFPPPLSPYPRPPLSTPPPLYAEHFKALIIIIIIIIFFLHPTHSPARAGSVSVINLHFYAEYRL